MTTRDAEPAWPLFSTLPGAWVNEAACADSQFKEAFHPSYEDGRSAHAEARYAKSVCAECSVINECLTWALKAGELMQGIAGGLNRKERQNLKRRAA